jgi:hypothetical protein
MSSRGCYSIPGCFGTLTLNSSREEIDETEGECNRGRLSAIAVRRPDESDDECDREDRIDDGNQIPGYSI